MVNLADLKKPTPVVKKAPEVKPEPVSAGFRPPASLVRNLHRDVRGQNAPKQFMLPPDVILDFEIEARKQGFKRDSQFFLAVWETYKASKG